MLRPVALSTCVAIASLSCCGCEPLQKPAAARAAVASADFVEPKLPPKSEMSSTGTSPYFVLQPGHQLILTHDIDTLKMTVLDETKVVNGIETRVVEERETADGKLVEVSRNYFAIAKMTGDVYYFGEDVDMYKDEKVTGHGGSWLAGVNGARPGIMFPGKPVVGAKMYQEMAPGAGDGSFRGRELERDGHDAVGHLSELHESRRDDSSGEGSRIQTLRAQRCRAAGR